MNNLARHSHRNNALHGEPLRFAELAEAVDQDVRRVLVRVDRRLARLQAWLATADVRRAWHAAAQGISS